MKFDNITHFVIKVNYEYDILEYADLLNNAKNEYPFDKFFVDDDLKVIKCLLCAYSSYCGSPKTALMKSALIGATAIKTCIDIYNALNPYNTIQEIWALGDKIY